MLYKLSQLQGHRVEAVDGGIGWVEDFYVDDRRWGVRYLVIDTGGWVTGRQVLISPLAVRGAEGAEAVIRLGISRDQIAKSPPLGEREPIGRAWETAHADFYGHPHYWHGSRLWGAAETPMAGARDPGRPPQSSVAEPAAGPAELETPAGAEERLFSSNKLVGYKVEASDGSVGHLDDLLMDDETWQIRHLVVDKRSWLPGGRVLVSPQAVVRLDPENGRVQLSASSDAVRGAAGYP